MERVVLLDVTQAGILFFSLLEEGGLKKEKKYRGQHPDVLACLDLFLKSNHLVLDKINALVLLEGQGSFSVVRQAVAVLNTIYLIKKIPVFGLDVRIFSSFAEVIKAVSGTMKKKHGLLHPIYSGEPNITIPRK